MALVRVKCLSKQLNLKRIINGSLGAKFEIFVIVFVIFRKNTIAILTPFGCQFSRFQSYLKN